MPNALSSRAIRRQAARSRPASSPYRTTVESRRRRAGAGDDRAPAPDPPSDRDRLVFGRPGPGHHPADRQGADRPRGPPGGGRGGAPPGGRGGPPRAGARADGGLPPEPVRSLAHRNDDRDPQGGG